MTEPSTVLDVCVRQALAEHLAVPPQDISWAATLGDELALDSLDVLSVVAAVGELIGRKVGLDHGDPAAIDKLGRLGQLTVTDFIRCLTVA